MASSFVLVLMKILVVAAGKPALPFAKIGIEEYLKRLTRYGSVELKLVKDGSSEEVSERLLEASKGCFRIVLDERGDLWTTETIVRHFRSWQMNAVKKVAFLIGAADGHTEALRQSGDQLLALSKFTLQHEFALVLLLEQIYRAHTILKGEPYHR